MIAILGSYGIPVAIIFIVVAMVVATMNFGSEEIVMVVVYSLITLIVVVPLSLDLGKRRKETANEVEEEKDLDLAAV